MFNFKCNPQLSEEENSRGKDCLEGFNEIYNVTCEIFRAFKGRSGKRLVAEVVPMIDGSSELQQFLFEFYYNTRVSSRLQSIYNHDE